MDHKEVLNKAIQKAINNGWDWNDSSHKRKLIEIIPDYLSNSMFGISFYELDLMDTDNKPAEMTKGYNITETIYNHDFAKALFTDSPHLDPDLHWQYHLQQMVISEDPIAYLGENLDG